MEGDVIKQEEDTSGVMAGVPPSIMGGFTDTYIGQNLTELFNSTLLLKGSKKKKKKSLSNNCARAHGLVLSS